MNKTVKIILIVVLAIAILFCLVKWVILPMTVSGSIHNQAQSSVENSDMSSAAASSFNSRYTRYEGTIKGSSIKALINDIYANNSTGENLIKVKFNGSTYTNNDVLSVLNSIETSNTYNVSTEKSKNGYVETIVIE